MPSTTTTTTDRFILDLDDVDDDYDYIGGCPACGNPIDYCQGHGEIGDPIGFAILKAHDNGDHTVCADMSYCKD